MNNRETNEQMEAIYQSHQPEEVPWHREEAPVLLRELVASGRIPVGGRVLDLGCGMGTQALYLARQGFSVTGIDVAPTAIEKARERAGREGLTVDFRVGDVLEDLSGLAPPFQFVLDWMILHHLRPADRPRYLANLLALLAGGGLYSTVSFSLADRFFGQPPGTRFRRSPLGPVVYCASLPELERFFSPFFSILESRVDQIPGRKAPHTVNVLLLQKR